MYIIKGKSLLNFRCYFNIFGVFLILNEEVRNFFFFVKERRKIDVYVIFLKLEVILGLFFLEFLYLSCFIVCL